MVEKKIQSGNRREKERVQLDFSHEALERLDEIKEISGAATRAEVMRQALRLYEWFIKETTPNSTISIVDEEGKTTSLFKAMLLHNALNIRKDTTAAKNSHF
jgi:Ribbon-helix-helix protein, copG family